MFSIGSEKSIVAHYGALILTLLTTVAVFFGPDTTIGHILVISIAVVVSVSTALGVYLTGNVPVVTTRTIPSGTPGPNVH